MGPGIHILGIAGSLRRESYNRATLRAATQLAPEGAKIDVMELDGIPGFNQDEEAKPPATVVELKRRIREADAILIVTPEYNYSVPGVLKNAIDWAATRFDASGNLTDEVTKGLIRRLLENLVTWTRRLEPPRPA